MCDFVKDKLFEKDNTLCRDQLCQNTAIRRLINRIFNQIYPTSVFVL